MATTIIWGVVVLICVALLCNTAESIAKMFTTPQPTTIKPLPEVDEHGEKLPSFDDIIATIYGREEEHE